MVSEIEIVTKKRDRSRWTIEAFPVSWDRLPAPVFGEVYEYDGDLAMTLGTQDEWGPVAVNLRTHEFTSMTLLHRWTKRG